MNVGDPVTPGPVDIEYPALLGQPFRMLGYPLATVLAEKVVTMVERGRATTRERDFADVVLLARRFPAEARELLTAMGATAEHREVTLRPVAPLLGDLGSERQSSWSTFVASVGLEGRVPELYAEAIALVAAFVDPLVDVNVPVLARMQAKRLPAFASLGFPVGNASHARRR